MKYALLLLALFLGPAQAGVVYHAQVESGFLILLEDAGDCGIRGRTMESRALIGNVLRFRGCWSAGAGPSGAWVQLDWDDGDRVVVPRQVFKPGAPVLGPQT
jgi:hypothetical protein